MQLVTYRKIFSEGTFVGLCSTLFPLDCDKLSDASPAKAAWLTKAGCQGCDENDLFVVVFEDPKDASAIKGVWVEVQGEGKGFLIDGTLADFVAKCKGCCGTDAAITPVYAGVFPDGTENKATTYTLTRNDTGDSRAFQRFQLDYLSLIKEGTLKRTVYDGTTSTYTFDAYKDPILITGDTKTAETARTFDSNTHPSLGAGEHFHVHVAADGGVDEVIANAGVTAGEILTALAANATTNALGTYSTVSSKTRLTTSTINAAIITITVEAD